MADALKTFEISQHMSPNASQDSQIRPIISSGNGKCLFLH